MDLKRTIDENYQIGIIIDIQKTEYGSGNTFIVVSEKGKFIAKLMNKEYEIILYDRVQKSLHSSAIKQPRVIQTISGNLICLDSLVLFEYIEGETKKYAIDLIELNLIDVIYEYNQELKNISFSISEFEVQNDWDRIRSLDYICNEANERILGLQIEEEWRKSLLESIGILRDKKESIDELDTQIIHMDLGADNFILKDNVVFAVIDFTPDINNELYALAHFVYWNYLWRSDHHHKSSIDFYLNHYYKSNEQEVDYHNFYLFLLNASVYRILGPLFEMSNLEEKNYRSLIRRFEIVDWIKKELL